MSYEEELEKAKQRYRDALFTSGIGQASEQIGAAIAGVEKPKDDFYKGIEKQGTIQYGLAKEDAKKRMKYDPNSSLSILARKKAGLSGLELESDVSLGEMVDSGINPFKLDAGGTLKKQELKYKRADQYRKEFSKNTEELTLVKGFYDNIKDAHQGKGAISDYKMIVQFAKLLDPNSVAREGEVNAVLAATSLLNKIGVKLGRVSKDMIISQAQRNAILKASKDSVANKIKNLRGIVEDAQYRIDEAGLDSRLVIGKRFKDLLSNKEFRGEGRDLGSIYSQVLGVP